MSALTDRCADCPHARADHGSPGPNAFGVEQLACRLSGCTCPAFDEGAPKPKSEPLTSRTRFVDADLLKPLGATLARILAGPRNQERALASQLMPMLDAAVVQSDRLQAAEREIAWAAKYVVARARDFATHPLFGETIRLWFDADGQRLKDACDVHDRLVVERHAEECGAIGMVEIGPRTDHVVDMVHSEGRARRCTLLRGHEGQHESELGTWRWT